MQKNHALEMLRAALAEISLTDGAAATDRYGGLREVETAHIDPGKPRQNGSNESFNGKFRDEYLSMQWFKNRTDAKILIENFRREYNETRPYSSLGQLTPIQFKQALSTTNPKAAFPSNHRAEESRQVIAHCAANSLR